MNLILSIFMYLSVLQFCASEPDQCIEDMKMPYDITIGIYVDVISDRTESKGRLLEARGQDINKKYDNTTIYLLVPNATLEEDSIMYEYFTKSLLEYKLKIIPEFCPGGVKGILKASQYIPNLINLFVSDFFESNYATILERNLFYAGKTRLKKYNKNCTGNGLEPIPDTCYDAKIISESIMDFKYLYEHTLRFGLNNTNAAEFYLEDLSEDKPPKPAILVCLEKRYIKRLENRPHNIEILFENPNECKEIMNSVQDSARLIAIVAAKPFDMSHEVSIPTLFYNQPYLSYEDKAKFPNSISVITQWRLLTHAFVKFMREMGWNRVAMISDDSEYSEEFEVEMSHVLQSENFAYHSYICLKETCDFDQMVHSILNARAKVIILNIDERNSDVFLLSIYKRNTRDIVMLVRDWPLPKYPYVRPKKFYSLSLGTYEKKNFNYDDDLPQINRINGGINTIYDCYRRLSIKNNEALTNLRKQLNSKLTSIPMDKNVLAFITEVNNNHDLVMVLKITQEHSKVDILMSNLKHQGVHPDRRKCDIINANSFSEPCGDKDFLLLFLVLIVSFAVILLVVYYINQVAYTNSYTHL